MTILVAIGFVVVVAVVVAVVVVVVVVVVIAIVVLNVKIFHSAYKPISTLLLVCGYC